MSLRRNRKWATAVSLHQQAVSELVGSIQSVPPEHWSSAEAEKWSPAHIVQHLSLAYEVLLQELKGGNGMGLRMKGWQRFLLRYTVGAHILRGGAFPPSARAPRETRPATFIADKNEAIQNIRERAGQFEKELTRTREENPKARLTHAYFGKGNLERSLTLCARHVFHHAKQLKLKS